MMAATPPQSFQAPQHAFSSPSYLRVIWQSYFRTHNKKIILDS